MRILVAGIGNIFHGDDAFGVEVANLLARRKLPKEVRVVDFGIRGYDLAYALLDGYDVTIFIDVTSCGGPPGSLYTIEIDPHASETNDEQPMDMGGHAMNPMRVLHMAQSMGGHQSHTAGGLRARNAGYRRRRLDGAERGSDCGAGPGR